MSCAPATLPVNWRKLWASGHLGRFLILCIGIWLHAANGQFIATILPHMVADLGGVNLVNWTGALYETGSIFAGVLAGFVAQRRGLKPVILTACAAFAAGAAVSALSTSMPQMLAGRMLQGLGGGGMIALTLIALRRLFPERIWPQLVAVQSAVWGASAFAGPFVGALFATYMDWRFGFWFFAAQAATFGLLMLRLKSPAPSQAGPGSSGPFPFASLVLLAAGIMLIAAAGVEIGPVRSPALLTAGFALLGLFIWHDARQSPASLLPSGAFALNTPLGIGMLAVIAMSMSITAFTLYGPLVLAQVFGAPAMTIGLVIVLESVGWTVAAIAFANSTANRERILIRTGAALLMLVNAGFAAVMPGGPFWAIPVLALLGGGAFGACWGFIIRRVVTAASATERDQASSSITAVQRTGFALGAAIAGIIANWAGFASGMTVETARSAGFWVFILFVPVAALGLIAAWRLTAYHAPVQPVSGTRTFVNQ